MNGRWQMKHLGNVCAINGAKVDPVDVITFGSPCQDLSVAGKRAGLEGSRSGLFYEAVRIIKEMRNETGRTDNGTNEHIRLPRYAIFENVPGALSSGNPKGEDFRIVLEEMCKIKDENAHIPRPSDGKWPSSGSIVGDGYSLCWRLHDSQWFGVPQRRRRLCVLIDLDGYTATEIVCELRRKTADTDTLETIRDIGNKPRSEVQPINNGLSRNTEQSQQERKEAATNLGNGTETSSYTLKVRGGGETLIATEEKPEKEL